MGFLVGYGIASVGPLAMGALRDATGGFEVVWVVLAALMLPQLVICCGAATRPGQGRRESAKPGPRDHRRRPRRPRAPPARTGRAGARPGVPRDPRGPGADRAVCGGVGPLEPGGAHRLRPALGRPRRLDEPGHRRVRVRPRLGRSAVDPAPWGRVDASRPQPLRHRGSCRGPPRHAAAGARRRGELGRSGGPGHGRDRVQRRRLPAVPPRSRGPLRRRCSTGCPTAPSS